MTYPDGFEDAIEKAKAKHSKPVSRLTLSMVSEFLAMEQWEVTYWLKIYKKNNRRVSKADKRSQLRESIESMIDASVDGINSEVLVSDLEALLDLI